MGKLFFLVFFVGVLLFAGCSYGEFSVTHEGEGLGAKLLAPVVAKTLGSIPCDSQYEERFAEQQRKTERFDSWTSGAIPHQKNAIRSRTSMSRVCGP
jgi:hypothetical protein